MSDYVRQKVVRLRISRDEAERLLGVDEYGDIKENGFFDYRTPNKFQIAPTEEFFIDYVLKDEEGEGDWGKTRELSFREFGKYVEIFRKILPENYIIKYENMRLVEYCWWNATEAEDYFDNSTYHDDFYDEV